MGKIKIVEVGPRDGLQNEKITLSQDVRLEFAERLARAGIQNIELGAFVSPQWVPQMAGSAELMKSAIEKKTDAGSPLANAEISALVPNRRGMREAIGAGVTNVAVFASASEIFAMKNINCSIEESFIRFRDVFELAKTVPNVRVRGYLSMCFGCPFEGEISEGRVVRLVKRLVNLGVYEVSIGDTIGVANPMQVRKLVRKLIDAVGVEKLAMHFHDTRGTALANISACLEMGVRTFDSSLGGLGGCPYSPDSSGNVATEDVAYMVHGMGFTTGIDLEQLIQVNKWMAEKIGHALPSRVGRAGIPKIIQK